MPYGVKEESNRFIHLAGENGLEIPLVMSLSNSMVSRTQGFMSDF